MAITISGTDGIVGAGFTVDNSGVSVTAGVGTFSSVRGTHHGDGANLTSLPAAQLTGTIADARFPATLPAASAANLTNVPAANITGTLPAIDGSNLTGIGGGITHARAYRLTSTYTLTSGSAVFTSNWEYDDDNGVGYLGSGWALPSSGIFSFPATGIYEVKAHSMYYSGGGTNIPYGGIHIEGTTDNSSYSSRAGAYSSQEYDDLSAARYHSVHVSAIFDVTNTSNDKFRIKTYRDVNYGDIAFMGDTNDNYTYLEVIRLGDT